MEDLTRPNEDGRVFNHPLIAQVAKIIWGIDIQMPTKMKTGHATNFYLFETVVDGRTIQVIRFPDDRLICVEEENGVIIANVNPLVLVGGEFTHL